MLMKLINYHVSFLVTVLAPDLQNGVLEFFNCLREPLEIYTNIGSTLNF